MKIAALPVLAIVLAVLCAADTTTTKQPVTEPTKTPEPFASPTPKPPASTPPPKTPPPNTTEVPMPNKTAAPPTPAPTKANTTAAPPTPAPTKGNTTEAPPTGAPPKTETSTSIAPQSTEATPIPTPYWDNPDYNWSDSNVNTRYKDKGQMPPYQIFIILVGVACVIFAAVIFFLSRRRSEDEYNPM